MKRPLSILLCCTLMTGLRSQEIFEIVALDIHPQGEDYAPVLLDGGFVMASVREPMGAIDHRDATTGAPLSDLYWVPFNGHDIGRPVLFSAKLATPLNEGPAALTDSGRTICYTRNLAIPRKLSNMRGTSGQLGLFLSTHHDGSWSDPVPFEHNHHGHALVHPTFDASGSLLFLASDMPGGFGGMDLYMSRRTDRGWSTPENLGPGINGPGNEVYPVLQPDGSLHFSSDRPGGLGGLDILATVPRNGSWSSPEPLPAPINSAGNDHGLTFSQGGLEGLLGSDRDGMDRIYRVKRTVEKFVDCPEQKRNNHCYAFRARPHAAMMNLPLDHAWDLGDGTLLKGLVTKHCYTGPGNYTVRSLLIDRGSGSVFHVLRTNVIPSHDHVQAYILAPDTVRTGRPFLLDPAMSNVPGMSVTEMHWDLGDGTRLTGDRIQHSYQQAGSYDVRLELIGEPRADGHIPNRCNMRRIVVMDRYHEQEGAGIAAVYQDAMGMTGHDYMELPYDEHHVTEDDRGDVKYSVELFASRERLDLNDPVFTSVRGIYRVVERYDPQRGMYTYSVGETEHLEELYDVFRRVKELDFLDAEVFLLDPGKLIDMSELDMAQLEDLNNTTVRSHAIRFAFNSADPEEGCTETLQRMKELLDRHPELHLVVEAHTDDVGGQEYNMELSVMRAEAVVERLVLMGIDPGRLIAIGHGKNHPLADNASEEGRSLNRRVEFHMTLDHVEQAFEKTR